MTDPMTGTTRRVAVTMIVEVTTDDSKFTDKFLTEFRDRFYPFEDIEDHVRHLAQLEARGLIDSTVDPDVFIEGYGPASEMSIKAKIMSCEVHA